MNIQLKTSVTCRRKLIPISIWAHLFSFRVMLDEETDQIVSDTDDKIHDKNTGKAIAEFIVRRTTTEENKKFIIETNITDCRCIRHKCSVGKKKDKKTLIILSK